jgi:misacylated tRNA(Ala) deacylase
MTTVTLPPTERLYLDDTHLLRMQGRVLAVRDDAFALDRSCFYPGGGGQPPDEGSIELADQSSVAVVSAQMDAEGVVWHRCASALPEDLVGTQVELQVSHDRREALARYHTVLHVLNTIALRDYQGWITGAQIAVDYSRIDFKLDGFSPQMRSDLEGKVNEVIAAARPLRARYLAEEEFNRSHDLLRTLEVRPPVHNGRVRIVEIEGFDAQACGGTHVRGTAEIGRFRIERTENKGKINKRLYVKLDPPDASTAR